MISAVYYIFLVLLCTFFMILSALALVVCYPFDKGRRVVHELSRILVRTFFAIPPRWRQRVEGLEHVDRKKSYVIVLNHNTVIDIPTLYYIPLNFRWVSKREVFKTPFFGQYLIPHGDICINRGRASEALEQMVRDGKLWISRGASVAVFPEGTRSKDGEIHRFKAGAFTLAREAGVEIICHAAVCEILLLATGCAASITRRKRDSSDGRKPRPSFSVREVPPTRPQVPRVTDTLWPMPSGIPSNPSGRRSSRWRPPCPTGSFCTDCICGTYPPNFFWTERPSQRSSGRCPFRRAA